MAVARVCFRRCQTIWPAEVTGGSKGVSVRCGQKNVLLLLGGLLGGLTGCKTPTKMSLVECLLWGFGHDDKVRNPMECYQEAILFSV